MLREELQRQARQALIEQKKLHNNLIKEHIPNTCLKAANLGFYETPIQLNYLSDGILLTSVEVEEFATENSLTYTPPQNGEYVTLSWHPNESQWNKTITTLRLQLQQLTEQILDSKQKMHKKLVEKKMKSICSEAVSQGLYETDVKFGCLSDGIPLTGVEVKEFANENNLTYTPPKNGKYATLSWCPEIIIGKSVIE